MTSRTEGAPTVKSARRVARILFLLGGHPGHARLAEVADKLEIPKSSAHALLQTLVAEDLLTRRGDGDYGLSPRWIAVLVGVLDRLDVRQAALPVMSELSRRFGSTSNLGILHAGSVIYVEQVRDHTHPVQLATHVGFAVPAHATALGKVLVAELPPTQREAWLAEHQFGALTRRTVTSRAELERQLSECRRTGFALDDEEFRDGVLCVAAAVRDHRGIAVGAVSITTIKSSFLGEDRDRAVRVGPEIREAADQISRALGWGKG
jgi:DNA-binding IclR family transcriptional regulator